MDGVRIDVDLCPGADDDCRCAILIGGVGADLAHRVGIIPGPFHATLTRSSIVLIASLSAGEAGAYEGVVSLYAENSYLDGPYYAVPGVLLSSEVACRVPLEPSFVGPCDDIGYAARVEISAETAGPEGSSGGAASVREGETITIPGTYVTARLLRANVSFCGPEGSRAPPSPPTSFVLWWEYPLAP